MLSEDGRGGRCLTRNFRFCFQWLPWAFVAIWASVTIRMRSHSSWVGSIRSHTVFCSSSLRRRSRFSSISFRLASLLLLSSTTGAEGGVERGVIKRKKIYRSRTMSAEKGRKEEEEEKRRKLKFSEDHENVFFGRPGMGGYIKSQPTLSSILQPIIILYTHNIL